MKPNMENNSKSDIKILKAVYNLAETTEYDSKHSRQVTNIALSIFDQLQPLHLLTEAERNYLKYASILHDIGWVDGWKGHHKTSLNIILNTKMLPFSSKERLIIGSIARYHRGSLPSNEHDHFRALKHEEKNTVRVLSALLRIADGMDHSHQSNLSKLIINITPKRIILKCLVKEFNPEDKSVAEIKSDLLMSVFPKYKLVIQWKTI